MWKWFHKSSSSLLYLICEIVAMFVLFVVQNKFTFGWYTKIFLIEERWLVDDVKVSVENWLHCKKHAKTINLVTSLLQLLLLDTCDHLSCTAGLIIMLGDSYSSNVCSQCYQSFKDTHVWYIHRTKVECRSMLIGSNIWIYIVDNTITKVLKTFIWSSRRHIQIHVKHV